LNEGTEIFQPKDAPGYVPGKIAILVLLTAQIFICFLLRWINLCLNRNKREVLEAAIARHGWTNEDVKREREKHAFLDMTDKQ
jgi:MFS transporter, ACS family, allantoate permease